ncbi:MAG: sigma-70 family RNA polymerase sigma factor [Patescibacteria group bacterium]
MKKVRNVLETRNLWIAFKKNPSPELKQKIILIYIDLVYFVLNKNKIVFIKIQGVSGVMEKEDFFHFGIEGLSQAIDRFDPNRGIKFETYAIMRIKGEIIDEVRKLEIKATGRKRYEKGKERDNYFHVSFDEFVFQKNDEGLLLHETIPDVCKNPLEIIEHRQEGEVVREYIKRLPYREKLIITMIYYQEMSCENIGIILGLTQSRVSQIHTKLLKSIMSRDLRELKN